MSIPADPSVEREAVRAITPDAGASSGGEQVPTVEEREFVRSFESQLRFPPKAHLVFYGHGEVRIDGVVEAEQED